jgi:YegS/Rv2252/BmrU family lipid kinase
LTHIHFIVNPIAGHGTSSLTREFLEGFFVKNHHQLTVKHSEYKKHATELTKNSILEGADIIVACGGDGTINEVASCLVGTKIPLGIVPVGSGNGLASNLGVPKNLRRSLAVIKNGHIVEIDTGSINENYFFSNTGVGFDASIIKNYESSERHTLIGYLKACLISFKESETNMDMKIRANDMEMRVNPFLIFISNSNEMGYKVSLTPKASLQDGLLDVMIISKIGRLKMIWLGILMLFKRPYLLKEATSFQTRNLELYSQDREHFDSQIDGELHQINSRRVSIQIRDRALKVIVPDSKNLNEKIVD